MKCLQQNDTRALSAVYDRYWKVLIDFAYKRLQNQQDAEEIVQEVFIKLYERRQELYIHTSLIAYLLTAVRYQVYNKYREWMHKNEVFRIQHLDDVDYSAPVYDIVGYKELEHQVSHSIQKLPEKCRETFLLSRNERLSNKQVAERLGVSVNTVEKHMGKALRILRDDLGKYDQLCVLLVVITGF